ncbi:MAG: TraR/DksA family transcriptional regulator [SAR324 cluster bacterium]|nr:TraR/DksA family transcriptional regulator [SAR324 cluster bacterium]
MQEIKAMLLKEKEKLIDEILKSQGKSAFEHEIGDEIDSSVEEQERKLLMLLQDREREKLEKIEEAIVRIENDNYGECEECGEPIAKKRLMIVPFTKLCINCQQEEERLKGLNVNDEPENSLRYMED